MNDLLKNRQLLNEIDAEFTQALEDLGSMTQNITLATLEHVMEVAKKHKVPSCRTSEIVHANLGKQDAEGGKGSLGCP